MDYLQFFNLNDDPFRLTPDPLYFFPSQEHNEILTSLHYAIEQKEGFSLIVGEPGTGKTTILRILMDYWKEKADIALIMTPRLSPEEFLQAVLEDIHVKLEEVNKNEMLKAFRDILIEHSRIEKRVIIIVDEAQNVPDETLEELRILSNLETEKEKLLQIILVGQSELKKRLQANHLKQLNQRIAIRATLKPLGRSETSDYINFRLIKAGKGAVNFDEDARKRIYKMSGGIPRVINLISSRAIMAAFVSGNAVIKKNHVNYAIEHLSDEPVSGRYFLHVGYTVLAILLVIAIFGIYKVRGNAQGIVDKNKPDSEKVVSVISKNTAALIINRSQAVMKKTGSTPLETFVKTIANKSQPQKMQYPPGTLFAGETVDRSVVGNAKGTVVVAAETANLRSKPSFDSDKVAWASKGTVLTVYNKSQDPSGRVWCEVRLPDGRECWISERVVAERQ
jgi:type II secretory pathway predicted ATPase ExeA